MFNYVEMAEETGKEIGVKRGRNLVGWWTPKKTVKRNKIGEFLKNLEKLQKKYPLRGGKNLSCDIDKILYGQK